MAGTSAVISPARGLPPVGQGIGRRAGLAIASGSITSMASRLLSLLGTVLLARLLTPLDFGIANVGAFLLMVLLPLTDIGVARVLVRSQIGDLHRRARTAFWLIALLG